MLTKLLKLQKRALRICTNSPKMSNSNRLFHKVQTLTVFYIHKHQIASFMYQAYNNNMPKAITELFPRINNVHSYSTRNTDKFYHLSSCTNVRKSVLRHRDH